MKFEHFELERHQKINLDVTSFKNADGNVKNYARINYARVNERIEGTHTLHPF